MGTGCRGAGGLRGTRSVASAAANTKVLAGRDGDAGAQPVADAIDGLDADPHSRYLDTLGHAYGHPARNAERDTCRCRPGVAHANTRPHRNPHTRRHHNRHTHRPACYGILFHHQRRMGPRLRVSPGSFCHLLGR